MNDLNLAGNSLPSTIPQYLAQLRAALDSRDLDEFAGEAETLLIMMQQHNMKEENILYPMCDLRLGGERDALVETLANRLAPEHAA